MRSRTFLIGGLIALALAIGAGAVAVALAYSSTNGAAGSSAAGSGPSAQGYGSSSGYGMMGESGSGYGMMGEDGSGYGMMGGAGSGSATAPSGSSTKPDRTLKMVVKSDTEHGKRGSDGQWHDAFLPSGFSVRPGETVAVEVANYDDMPHSFTAPSLGLNVTIPGGSANSPHTTTFTFTAPSGAGQYAWWCAVPCDPFSMARDGFMRGAVTVS